MKTEMIEVNGKVYPLWSQFVNGKEQWIGGLLEDTGDFIDRKIGFGAMQTQIEDVVLRPNGKDSAFFEVQGREFNCGFDVGHGGVAAGEPGWITFRGYGGHIWRIKPIKS